MNTLKLAALLCLVIVGVVFWLIHQIYYRITRTHMEVRIFGFCLRRIALTDIARISKRRPSFCEKWGNTLFPVKRTLVIQRRTGWIKHVMITPLHRYTFKAELKKMIIRRWAEISQERAAQGASGGIPALASSEKLDKPFEDEDSN